MTRRVTVEVFDPASTRVTSELLFITTSHGPRRKHTLSIVVKVCLQRRCIATEVIPLLLAYSLPRKCVYRVVAQQWTSILSLLFRLSSVISQYLFPLFFVLRRYQYVGLYCPVAGSLENDEFERFGSGRGLNRSTLLKLLGGAEETHHHEITIISASAKTRTEHLQNTS
jgi:hypothetical protein